MGAIKNAFHDDLELRRAIEDGEAELQAVAPAPHSASPSGSTNSAFGAVPSLSRGRITEWACNGLLLIGAVVSTYLVVTQ